MEKIILADGTEREVPTAEELAMLNKLQEEHQTLKTKMEVTPKQRQHEKTYGECSIKLRGL